MREHQDDIIYSDAIGIVRTPSVQEFPSGLCMTSVAVDHPPFVKLLNHFLAGSLDEMASDVSATCEEHDAASSFRWTTITVNQDMKAARHMG